MTRVRERMKEKEEEKERERARVCHSRYKFSRTGGEHLRDIEKYGDLCEHHILYTFLSTAVAIVGNKTCKMYR